MEHKTFAEIVARRTPKRNNTWEAVQGWTVGIIGGLLLAAVIAIPLLFKLELGFALLHHLNK